MRFVLILVPILLTMKVALGAGQPSWFPEKKCKESLLKNTKETKEKRESCYKQWTVLVFMEADNDLSPYSYWDLYEMERKMKRFPHGASSLTSDVLVEWDDDTADGVRRLHMQEVKEEYNRSVDLNFFKEADASIIKSPILKTIGERDHNISERLSHFLKWGVKKYPSKNYMVVIWGHGEGYIGKKTSPDSTADLFPTPAESNSLFLSEGDLSLNFDYDIPQSTFPSPKPFGGVALDYSELEYLDLPTISKILGEVRDEVLEGEKLDLLAFDACLMQSLEVAIEVKDSVEFLVGSDQIQNYLGLPYKMILSKLNSTTLSPYELAGEIPTIVEESFGKTGYQGNVDPEGIRTFTVSSINLTEMEFILLPTLSDFSKAMIDYIDEKPIRKLELGFILEKTPSFQGEGRDLGLFMGSILMLLHEEADRNGLSSRASTRLRRAANDILQGINRATMNYAYGTMYYSRQDSQNKNYLLGFFKGLSVWVPKSSNTYKIRRDEFEQSALFKISHKGVKWQDWLDKIHSDDSPFPFK
ncbi:MAG: hypothetical protein KC493_17950 [Bacteriovoracaceae bacterium]|nr:hypothetical protein [Bacteriovoracaceae bacterium]